MVIVEIPTTIRSTILGKTNAVNNAIIPNTKSGYFDHCMCLLGCSWFRATPANKVFNGRNGNNI